MIPRLSCTTVLAGAVLCVIAVVGVAPAAHHGGIYYTHNDGHVKLAGDKDRHASAHWHNQQNQHDYTINPHPASLPPLGQLSALNSHARHARRMHVQRAGAGRGRQLYTAPGETTSTACGTLPAQCAVPSASTFGATTTQLSLSYNTATGIFTWSIVTDQCPEYAADFQYNGSLITHPVPTSCISQAIPGSSTYTPSAFPMALPIGGRIGIALRSGENIYGSMDQGFTPGQACTNGLGTCPAGSDVMTCAFMLEYQCGTKYRGNALLSDCGTHANPLHMHESASCEYDENDASAHSTLVAAMLDGRGLYGRWEANGLLASSVALGDGSGANSLDACNGHFGPVPASTVTNPTSGASVTYPAATNVYHYHVQHSAPFFAGCWGPVANLSVAMTLYSGCATVQSPICTSMGMTTNYTYECPVYQDQYGAKINYLTPTAVCPVCAGNCAPPTMTGTPTSSPSHGAVASSTGTCSNSRGPKSQSVTPPATPTLSLTLSSTASATASVAPSVAVSASAAATATRSGSPSAVAASTVSAAASPNGSVASTVPESVTVAPSSSAAATAFFSGASSATATAVATASSTAAATASTSSAATASTSSAATASASTSSAATASTSSAATASTSSAATASTSSAATPTASTSGASTRSVSAAVTPSATASPSSTGTASASATASASLTGTAAATQSATVTSAASTTGTAASTASSTAAATPSGSASTSAAATATGTAAATDSGTVAATASVSASPPPTMSPSSSGTAAASTSAAPTPSTSSAASASAASSASTSLTASASAAVTATVSPSLSAAATRGTPSISGSAAASPSRRASNSASAAKTGTPASTATRSTTATPSSTRTSTRSATGTRSTSAAPTQSRSSSAAASSSKTSTAAASTSRKPKRD